VVDNVRSGNKSYAATALLISRSYFKKPERCSDFAKLTTDDVEYFKSVVDANGIVQDKFELEPFNTDWLGKYKGQTSLALRPKSTEEVSKILEYCNKRKLAVVPQGGNTGLVGGSVPVYDEIVINLQRMNKVVAFNEVSGTLVCEAGAILQTLDQFAEKKGCIIPLDLGAKGSCQIGGNAATNAGGIRLLRYGSLHGSILGLEAVLPDGRILDNINVLRKDNTGYDIKQLFIGSEGTLGIITKLAILCPPRPKSINVMFLALDTFESVQNLFIEAKKELGEILSAFEFLDRRSLETVLTVKGVADPLAEKKPFYVLIETSGSNTDHDKEKVSNFLEKVMGEGIVTDGTIAQDETQVKSLWFLRETIPESLGKAGKVYKYDISLPVSEMYTIVEEMKKKFVNHKDTTVIGYGHLGDANLHLNVMVPQYNRETEDIIEPYVYEFTASHKGSISAEHGLGVMKANLIHYSKSPVMVELMKAIKKVVDPNGIMNPYKVLPE
jgi:FAD/FMN-containing dehydrogenase